jgi:hypothetical protein
MSNTMKVGDVDDRGRTLRGWYVRVADYERYPWVKRLPRVLHLTDGDDWDMCEHGERTLFTDYADVEWLIQHDDGFDLRPVRVWSKPRPSDADASLAEATAAATRAVILATLRRELAALEAERVAPSLHSFHVGHIDMLKWVINKIERPGADQ